MFDGLSRSLEKAWDSVRKDGKLTADNIKGPLRDIRWVGESTGFGSGCLWSEARWSEGNVLRAQGERRKPCAHTPVVVACRCAPPPGPCRDWHAGRLPLPL